MVAAFSMYLFGNTMAPKQKPMQMSRQAPAAPATLRFEDLLAKAKQRLNEEQAETLAKIENESNRGDVKQANISRYRRLSAFWKDTMHLFEPYAFYLSEAAKLEKSEKSLTFAAQQFLGRLMVEGDPAMQNWLASNAKPLLDMKLVLKPDDDSSKIGLGACYILGNISGNPMEGILPVREIAQKNPDNLYAQYILGLGGKKSGQLPKAIERFLIIAQKDASNLDAALHLAECYDMNGEKENASKWYFFVKEKIKNPSAKKELEDRILALKK